MKITVNSARFGRAWSAAMAVAPDDSDRPALDRSVSVEHYEDHGLRLIATDGYVLVRAWVPLDEAGDNMEPEHEELPDHTYLVTDTDRRAHGLVKYICKLHKKEDEELWPELELTIRAEDQAEQGVLGGMEQNLFHIAWPFHEDVAITLRDLTFPSWRAVQPQNEAADAKHISLTSVTLGSLAKLCDLYPGYSMDWTLRGELGIIDFTVGPLSGLLMPARSMRPSENDAAEQGEDA